MIDFRSLNKSNKVFVIAEIGNNHEGKFTNALKLIAAAKKAGVDAVKFQTYKTEEFIHPFQKKRFKKLKKFELSYEDFYKLSLVTKKNNLKFISTPFDIESVFFLKKIVDIFKISSGDNNYYDLIEKVISFKIPTIISTGLCSLEDIKQLCNFLKKKISIDKIALLHCISSYPALDKDANLFFIRNLIKNFSSVIGFSDHTIGKVAPLIAATLGAKIIEKHFTLDNNFSSFRDHKISLNPKDMKELIKDLKRFSLMTGVDRKIMSFDEKMNIKSMRRSLYVNKDLEVGHKILKKDISTLRPFCCSGPLEIKNFIGKRSKYYIKSFSCLKKISFK